MNPPRFLASCILAKLSPVFNHELRDLECWGSNLLRTKKQ